MELLTHFKEGKSERSPLPGILAGTCSADHPLLESYRSRLNDLLPGAASLIVFAVAHSRTALEADNIPIKQFDTLYAYRKAGDLSHQLCREIEAGGYRGAAIPVYLPMDMLGEGKGMRGEICWRRAGVAAGLGYYGRNGLLITPEYGPRVRLGGLLTDYPLAVPPGEAEDISGRSGTCGDCRACLERCPAGALSEYAINKKLCGDRLFAYGLRRFSRFLDELCAAGEQERQEMVHSPALRELWQNFMTGGYYYCWECQAACPEL